MRKFVIVLCIAAVTLPLSAFAGSKPKVDQLSNLIREYKSHEDFESLSIGRLGLMIMSGIAKGDTHGDGDTQAAISMMKGLKRITIAEYESCSQDVKKSFRQKAEKILNSLELLVSHESDGESQLVYADVDEEGKWVSDVVVYLPEDCSMILLSGKLKTEQLRSIFDEFD